MFAVGFLVLAAAVEVGLLTGSGPLVIIGSIAVGLFAAWVLLALVTSSARRLHDLGLSGWFSLLVLVPVTGALAMLAGSLIDGKAASNRFGASPKYSAQ